MNNIILKPRATNIIRYHLIGNLIGMPVGMSLAMLFITTRSSFVFSWKEIILFWLALSLAGTMGSLLGQLLVLKKSVEKFSIVISDGNIIGPKSWSWRTESLEIGKLDKARSSHRSLFQRLFRMRSLWFRDRKRIEICDAFYGKEQIETLLGVLQLKN